MSGMWAMRNPLDIEAHRIQLLRYKRRLRRAGRGISRQRAASSATGVDTRLQGI